MSKKLKKVKMGKELISTWIFVSKGWSWLNIIWEYALD